jgi:hypothetical protein
MRTAVRKKTALTLSQAYEALGISAGASESEIIRAWRTKARLHHPDLGGDVAKMQAVNHAKDILTGKSQPDPEPFSGSNSWTKPKPEPKPEYKSWTKPEPEPEQPSKNKVSFEEALPSFPSTIQWLFCTQYVSSGPSYSSDEVTRVDDAFAVYGIDGDNAYIVGLRHFSYEQHYAGGGPFKDIWTCKFRKRPLAMVRDHRDLTLTIMTVLDSLGAKPKTMPKIFPAKGGWLSKLTPDMMRKFQISGGNKPISLKEWLGGTAPKPKTPNKNKTAVVKFTYDPGSPKWGLIPGPASVTLRVDNATYSATSAEVERLIQVGSIREIFGTTLVAGTKSITMLKNKVPIIKRLLLVLKNLPAPMELALQRIIEPAP